MFVLLRTHYKVLGILLGILVVLELLTYQFLFSKGIFSDLENDLKALQADETAVYTDLDGNIIDLKKFKGKPLIINSWATWTPFSIQELGLLEKIKEQYGDAITVLAINRMENTGVIKSFLSTYGITGDVIMINDTTDNFYKVVGGYAMPETMFYTKDGVISTHKRGVMTEEELNEYVARILQKN